MRTLKRIAILTHINVLEAGGVAHSISRIARGLSQDSGIEVDIVIMDAVHQASTIEEYRRRIEEPVVLDGLPVYNLRSWQCGLTLADRWSAISAYNWSGIHLAICELYGRRGYDLLHGFPGSITGFPVAYAARELNIPCVVSIRGSDINRDVHYQDRFYHLVWALQNCTEFTAVSRQALERARIVSGCRQKGHVILNSIRPSDFAEGVIDLALPRPLIGAVGEFKSTKGPEALFAAFKLLLERHPGAHLLVVGDGSKEERDYFYGVLKHYNLDTNVTVTGMIPHTQVLRYLRVLDVFVLPSFHDGCPNALLEAMLAGAPIVATRAGAVPELIEHMKEGLLVEPTSIEGLCDSLEQMLQADTTLYRKNAQARVLQQCSPNDELASYVRIYRHCLEADLDAFRENVGGHLDPTGRTEGGVSHLQGEYY